MAVLHEIKRNMLDFFICIVAKEGFMWYIYKITLCCLITRALQFKI